MTSRNPVPRSYECPGCERTFTTIARFKSCPVCTEDDGTPLRTVGSDRLSVYNAARADRLIDQFAEFGRRYAQHEAKHKALGKPSPDELGRLQARKEARQMRELEQAYEAAA